MTMAKKKPPKRNSNFQDARNALDAIRTLTKADPARRKLLGTVSDITRANHLGGTFGLAARNLGIIGGRGRNVTWDTEDEPSDEMADRIWQAAKELNRQQEDPAKEPVKMVNNVAQFPHQSLGAGAQMALGPLLPEEAAERDTLSMGIAVARQILDDRESQIIEDRKTLAMLQDKLDEFMARVQARQAGGE